MAEVVIINGPLGGGKTTLNMWRFAFLAALVAAVGVGASCKRAFDSLFVCVLPSEDRIVVDVHAGCASDHKGAKLSCTVAVGGAEVEVTAKGHDGRDREDVCAPDLIATCESSPLPAGEYVVRFRDEEFSVILPNDEHVGCGGTSGP